MYLQLHLLMVMVTVTQLPPLKGQQLGTVAEYTVQPQKLGVEVVGINLQDHVENKELFNMIKADVYKHRLMLFRGQGEIPADSMLKMFAHFGSIYLEPFTTQTKNLTNHEKAPSP